MGRLATGSASPAALDLVPGIPSWKQQPGESNHDYARFKRYCELKPLQRRDLQHLYNLLVAEGDPYLGSVGTLKNVATLNRWQDRVRDKEAADEQALDEALEAETRLQARDFARRALKAREDQLDVADKVKEFALNALMVKDPEDLTGAEIATMLRLVVEINQKTLPMAHPQVNGTANPAHLDQLGDDQAQARLAQLAEELAHRMNTSHPAAAAALDVLDAEVIPSGDSSDDRSQPEPADVWPEVPPPRELNAGHDPSPAEPGGAEPARPEAALD